jgi:signal transduction histidine kinase
MNRPLSTGIPASSFLRQDTEASSSDGEYTLDNQPLDWRQALVHMMSHDLRTPLSVIQSSAELLRFQAAQQATIDASEVLLRMDQILLEISRSTILLSRLAAINRMDGSSDMGQAPALNPLDTATRVIAERFSPYKDGRTVTMSYKGTPTLVRMDSLLLESVFLNLLDNACKYSSGREAPLLCIEFSPSKWSLSVSDHGIGIPSSEELDLGFPFSRGSNVGATPGMGLGLSIVKTIVHQYGGRLSIRSQEGKGTTVRAVF